MQMLQTGYRGLELLVYLNLDRFAAVIALALALFLASYIGIS